MRNSILRHGSVSRVTANFGNRGFIRGGVPRFFYDPPVFIGPDIPAQSWTVGVPVSYYVAPLFTGSNLRFSSDGLPLGLAVSPEGLVSGTPTTASNGFATIIAGNRGNRAESNKFAWTVA
jgi:hypothetical protein